MQPFISYPLTSENVPLSDSGSTSLLLLRIVQASRQATLENARASIQEPGIARQQHAGQSYSAREGGIAGGSHGGAMRG